MPAAANTAKSVKTRLVSYTDWRARVCLFIWRYQGIRTTAFSNGQCWCFNRRAHCVDIFGRYTGLLSSISFWISFSSFISVYPMNWVVEMYWQQISTVLDLDSWCCSISLLSGTSFCWQYSQALVPEKFILPYCKHNMIMLSGGQANTLIIRVLFALRQFCII